MIYVRGTDEEMSAQLVECERLVVERGYVVEAVVRERPGSTAGYDEANRFVDDGGADRVIVASASLVPDRLESATGALPGPAFWSRLRNGWMWQRPAARTRRIRPTRRGRGGGA